MPSATLRRSLVSLGLLSSASVAEAQLPPRTFSEVVEVRVVNIEVVVTDKQGNRVKGLAASDFRLRVDGEEVPIEYFTEVQDGSVMPPPKVEAGGPRQVPAVGSERGVGTSYLVFIDEYFAVPHDRDRALEKLREQLPLLGDQDRMAVVAFSGDKLEMLSSWSRSQEELDDVFRRAAGRPAHGLKRFVERRNYDQLLSESVLRDGSFGDSFFSLDSDERHYAQLLVDQVDRAVTAAASTLRSFASPPGRKVMLLLSGGWPYDPVEFVLNDVQRQIVDDGLALREELFAPLSDTANLLGYTVYAIDLGGLQSSAFGDASSPTLGEESARTLSFIRETNLHSGLDFLARETGGEALLNARRSELFSRPVADTRSYYWLGFSPKRKGDDERHEIKVEVLRQGLKVRARDGFLDFSRSREVDLAVESALYFGNPPSPQPLLVRVGKPEKSGRRKMIVPLTIAIPVDAVTFIPSGERRLSAELELRLAVLDKDGASLDEIPVIPIRYVLKETPPGGTFLRYETRVRLRNKEHNLVVALYDMPSGALLSTAVEIIPN